MNRQDVRLDPCEARDVLAAVITRFASDVGVDLLLIKGPTLAHHGLRPPRAWGDVDVLARPTDALRLSGLLAEFGWTAFNEPQLYPVVVPQHATTLVHERWRPEIDLHHMVPGCYANPQGVFDLLWHERTTMELAHQPVMCCGRFGSAVVAGVNLLRNPGLSRADELQQWIAAVTSWPPADRRRLAEVATAAGASDVMADLLDRVAAPAVGRGTTSPANLTDWGDRVSTDAIPGYGWLLAFRRTPLRAKPAVAWRAVTFSREALYSGLPQPRGIRLIRTIIKRSAMIVRMLVRRLQLRAIRR